MAHIPGTEDDIHALWYSCGNDHCDEDNGPQESRSISCQCSAFSRYGIPDHCAGGSFSAVITAAGVSDAIKNLVSGISGNTALILFIAWFLGMAFRQITGSGTVASLTTFAIMQSVTATIACHPVFLALACLDGALFGATVNDSGFWIVSNMAGLNLSGGVKTYTLGQAIASVVGIILIIVVGCISCLF